MFGNLK
jgi:hypothetical protein